jgi:pimeloyl-ACP methyl ester carboxylesterase
MVVAFALTATMLEAQAPGVKMREAFADLPGVRIWYIDSGGTGTPVVFLHAATGSVRAWENQIKAFTSAGFRFIAYDRRGWGRSVPAASDPQPGTAADDLEHLMDYLKIDRFHLVGTAAGGIVALDYALSSQKRLRSLVIANSIGGVVDEDYQKVGRWMRPGPSFEALPPELKELGPTYRAANRAGAERWIELQRLSRPNGPQAPAQTSRNRLTFASLETLNVPALVIAGGADLYAPPAVMRLFASHIRNAKIVTIPDAGHSAYWETPDAFNRTVLQFLRRVK